MGYKDEGYFDKKPRYSEHSYSEILIELACVPNFFIHLHGYVMILKEGCFPTPLLEHPKELNPVLGF